MDLTIEDLNQARDLYTSGKLSEMYDYLAARGDRYAELANGVALGNTFAGVMALEHLENVATDGGSIWTGEDVQLVRERMAEAYLDALDDNLSRSPDGRLTKDISAQDAQDFHREVFTGSGRAGCLGAEYAIQPFFRHGARPILGERAGFGGRSERGDSARSGNSKNDGGKAFRSCGA